MIDTVIIVTDLSYQVSVNLSRVRVTGGDRETAGQQDDNEEAKESHSVQVGSTGTTGRRRSYLLQRMIGVLGTGWRNRIARGGVIDQSACAGGVANLCQIHHTSSHAAEGRWQVQSSD